MYPICTALPKTNVMKYEFQGEPFIVPGQGTLGEDTLINVHKLLLLG